MVLFSKMARAPLRSPHHNNVFSATSNGPPATNSTHLSSRSTCSDSVWPVAVCTLRMSSNVWSRDITEMMRPALFHCTDVRYSNASASHRMSVERFCRSMMCNEVRALLVPAKGYLRVCGSSVGCDGSAMVISSIGELSTRSTTSASLFGDHQ